MVKRTIQASADQEQIDIIEEVMEEIDTRNFSKGLREVVIRYNNYLKVIEAYKNGAKENPDLRQKVGEIIYSNLNYKQRIERLKEFILKPK